MRLTALLTLFTLVPGLTLSGAIEEKVNGYAEWRRGDTLVVEGQVVRAHAGTRFSGDAQSLAAIPLGYELEARGERGPDGVLVAREIKSKPNGSAMFESDVLEATDEIEAVWVEEGRMFEPGEKGSTETIGRLVGGPHATRVRDIMRRLTPPYVDFDSQVRVHVVDTQEWNAAAMGNGAIWVYTGLIDSMSDDELAVVLGHELAHYTHEHSRRQAKSSMWQGLLGLGALLAAEAINDDLARGAATVAAGLGMTVWASGYSRDLEDQADRVGLRYAHEGGYDVGAGTRLWGKFRDRYGEADNITNFFFGSHSRPTDRIRNIEAEIALNYRSSPPWSFEPVPPAPSRVEAEVPAEESNEWVDQVRAQLTAFERELGRDYEPTSEAYFETLEAGQSETLEMEVERGVEYVVFGACDEDCDDLDLFAYRGRGQEVTRDIEPDDYPVLQFVASETGTWSIRVEMIECAADVCVYGVRAYER